eukprot:Sspe_Gene.94070::Locus_66541_Transcript_1_1_Confidence_1.000_Length_1675::g.94070::m.94070
MALPEPLDLLAVQQADIRESSPTPDSILGIDLSQSVMAVSEATKPAYTYVRTQRPAEEVYCSVASMLDLDRASSTVKRHVQGMVKELLSGECAVKEMRVFDAQLQSLLVTVFTQIAEFVDCCMKQDGTQEATTTESCILGGLVAPSVVSDIVSAARLSLVDYHRQCLPLRRKKPPPSPRPYHGRRRLSSVLPDEDCLSPLGTGQTSVAGTFVQAFLEGSLAHAPPCTPKRRPSTRVEREDDSNISSPIQPPQRRRRRSSASFDFDNVSVVTSSESPRASSLTPRPTARRSSVVNPPLGSGAPPGQPDHLAVLRHHHPNPQRASVREVRGAAPHTHLRVRHLWRCSPC